LRADQQAYDLLVAKKLDPTFLARDVLYRYDPTLLHVPLFIDVHAALSQALERPPEAVLVWLAWPMGILYVAGHYILFRWVSGSAVAAGLATLGAITIRNALGGEFWGFDGVPSVATRTILAGLTPPLLIAFVGWRTRSSFPLFFLALGALFNVHPVSAYQLAEVTALAHLALARLRLRALRDVTMGVGLFVLGASPYLVRFFPARDNLPHAGALTRAALDYRFDYLLYPIKLDALVSVSIHASLLATVCLWSACRAERPDGAHPARAALVAVAGCALIIAFGGLALIQGLGVWLDRPYLDIQQLRATRLVYPVLLCGLAVTYARLLTRRTWRAHVALALLVGLSLVPPASVIHAVDAERRDAVKRWLGMRVPSPTPSMPADPGAEPALHSWVRERTPVSALVFTDDFDFRLQTRRAITGSFKDGALLFLAGTRPFTAWYELHREIVTCRAASGRGCWFSLARRLDADYVVVDPGLAEAGTPPDFVRAWRQSGFELWQRVR